MDTKAYEIGATALRVYLEDNRLNGTALDRDDVHEVIEQAIFLSLLDEGVSETEAARMAEDEAAVIVLYLDLLRPILGTYYRSN